MGWNERYSSNKQPSFTDINKFINNSLWEEINEFIKKVYEIEPVLGYSSCSAQPRLEY